MAGVPGEICRREGEGGPGAGVPAGAAPGEATALAGLAGRAGGEDGGRVGGRPGPALWGGLPPAAADWPDGEEVPPAGRGILAGDPGHRREGRHSTVLEENASVRQIVDSYKAPLPQDPQAPRSPKVYLMLNYSTGHPRLWCQGSIVTWNHKYQECPETSERFDRELCILGHAGYTTGWNWWEVSVEEADCVPVGGRACWAIGVAKESVRRKGGFQLSPQEGIRALGKRVGGGIIAFSKVPQKVFLQGTLQRLRVRLGYEAETVEFLDAETEISLYTFQTGPFLGGQKGVTLQWEENLLATKGFWS